MDNAKEAQRQGCAVVDVSASSWVLVVAERDTDDSGRRESVRSYVNKQYLAAFIENVVAELGVISAIELVASASISPRGGAFTDAPHEVFRVDGLSVKIPCADLEDASQLIAEQLPWTGDIDEGAYLEVFLEERSSFVLTEAQARTWSTHLSATVPIAKTKVQMRNRRLSWGLSG